MLRPILRRLLAAVLLAGAVANASAANITFSAGYEGPWEWDEVTMTTRTEGSGMNTAIYYKGTASITGYNGSDTEIEIPSRISWYHDVTGPDLSIHYEYEVEVVAIGFGAFSGNSSRSTHWTHNRTLTSITIPDSVTSIGGVCILRLFRADVDHDSGQRNEHRGLCVQLLFRRDVDHDSWKRNE